MNRTLAVFDLDGTLVDSLPDLHATLNRVLHADLPVDAVRRMIGDGAAVLVRRAQAALGRPEDPANLAAFLADYENNTAHATRPYDGIIDLLNALRSAGARMAVCTNKPEAAAHALLAALGLDGYFSAIGGGDSFPTRKPDPAHLRATIQAAGGDAAHAVMVGDHANDVNAAKGAGIPSIFAAWGYGTPDMATGATAIAAAPAGVLALIEKVRG